MHWQAKDPAPRAGDQQYTGRYLVLGREARDAGLVRTLRDQAGLTMASSSDFSGGAVDMARIGGADGVYLEEIGVAITSSAPDQLTRLTQAGAAGDLLTVEREHVVYALHVPRSEDAPMVVPASASGVLGIQAMDALVCGMVSPWVLEGNRELDERERTWGLVSTAVVDSTRTGRGIRVAVLDTGLDLKHPDFSGRRMVTQSFVEGETVQDGQSHGTHCIGTALGPMKPGTAPRYGVAVDADLYVGKVLSDSGSGTDGAVLTAINWAVTNRCRIVSMSLGSAGQPGVPYSQVYETAAQRALAANTLLIAAAGNESRRDQGRINPVGRPANCPSVMAVGAVDSEMRVAPFSTRGTSDQGGSIDLVGPGVDVYSTVPSPDLYGVKSGTSMACPHVAGIAALVAEANPQASARDIWAWLVQNAKRLSLDPADMGAGLVQAPR
jgi:subtilisin family serine protease